MVLMSSRWSVVFVPRNDVWNKKDAKCRVFTILLIRIPYDIFSFF